LFILIVAETDFYLLNAY